MTKDQPSARQKRHDRTWQAIHDAAYELVKSKGLRQTTVDEIAERAGVSPRTFFNYFPTKDDAVLGLRAPKLTEQMLEQDAARSDRYIFVRMTLLMMSVLESAGSDRTLQAVQEFLPDYSELKARIKQVLAQTDRILMDFLSSVDWERFAAKGRRGAFPFLEEGAEVPEVVRERARVFVHVSYAILRSVAASGVLPLEDDREELVEQTVQMIQRMLRQD